VRTVLSIEYAQPSGAASAPRRSHAAKDRDHDGVPDGVDACPDEPGDERRDPAINGCPPAPDTDRDGVDDRRDACPKEPGVASADPTINGCPGDADRDGVPDSSDACPMSPGVQHGDATQNGCPADGDRDGVIDVEDACPTVAGATTRDTQTNGCPLDPDRDHDGILNDDDGCPDEAGAAHGEAHKNGCPAAALRGGVIRIRDDVRFEAGSARIARGDDTDATLRGIAKVLLDHPEITKLEVQGHTDDRGDPKVNKRLSEARARAVVQWLVGQGLEASRFVAKGYGSERPIESNTTEAGRKANRRVELHATFAKDDAPSSEKVEEVK
jgi:outer membrane protein OmpA-like peptidoglycan-associated protein